MGRIYIISILTLSLNVALGESHSKKEREIAKTEKRTLTGFWLYGGPRVSQTDASKELLKKANDYADAFKLKFPNEVKTIASETMGDETNLDEYVGLSYMHTQGSQVSITVEFPALKQGEKLKEKQGEKLEASGETIIDAHRDWLNACYKWFNALQDNGNRQGFLFGECGVPNIETKNKQITFSSRGKAYFKP